jgi:drug/metabolite transporter (DMT)-like permease
VTRLGDLDGRASLNDARTIGGGGLWSMVYLGLLFASAVWGTQFVLAKLLVDVLPATTLALARSVIALVCFVIFAATLPGRLSMNKRDLPRATVFSILGSVIYQGCFFGGLQFASASEGALLLPTMNPVFTVLVARLLGHERPTRGQVLGMCVSAVGVVLVFQAAMADAGGGQRRLLGDVLFLISSLAWALQSVLGRALFAKYGPVRTLAVSSVIGILPLWLLSNVAGDTSALLRTSISDWVVILALAFFSAFVAFVLFNKAVVEIGAGAAARFNNLIPVWGIAVAVPVLGERPPLFQLVGGALIVLGVWVSSSAGASRVLPRLGLRLRPAR